MKTSLTIKMSGLMTTSITATMTSELLASNDEGDINDTDDQLVVGRPRQYLPDEFGPYADEFLTYLDRCYSLMDEVWLYKRTLESVEDFWERVVVEPDRRFAAEQAKPKNVKRIRRKRKFLSR